jgi:hypothetical protein
MEEGKVGGEASVWVKGSEREDSGERERKKKKVLRPCTTDREHASP